MSNSARTEPADKYSATLNVQSPEQVNALISQAIDLMRDGKLSLATSSYNEALRYHFTDSSLQLLNGINYHLRAISGDGGLYKLAEQGYLAAIRLDQSNFPARYYLGLLYIDMGRYEDARSQLGTYVLHDDNDPEGLYYLAVSSYYSGDVITAHSAAQRLWEVSGQQNTPDIDPSALLRLMSIVTAATDNPEESKNYIDKFIAETDSVDKSNRLKRRIEDWQYFYSSNDSEQEGGSEQTLIDEDNLYNEDDEIDYSEDDSESEFIENQMVAVDIVIIRTEEDFSTRRGINLLDGLNLQFGDPLDQTPAFNKTRSQLTDYADRTLSESTRSIVSSISIPAVNYTLNILNDQDQHNEIIAQPTLVARAGQTSEFFSGVEVLGAAVSGGAGDSVSIEKEIGVKLGVTPEFGPDGSIILNVIAERTFLTQPSRSVEFEFRLDTSKTTVNANVAMRYGQTLVLSGLNEKDVEYNMDGVPVLKDIPLVKTFFSRETSREFSKSVIILLTPHPTQYLYNSASNNDENNLGNNIFNRNGITKNLADRYETWFQPIPNIQRILSKLAPSDLYHYFQSGDLEQDAWYKSNSHEKRLQAILGRLSS